MSEFINQLNIHIPNKYHPFHADMILSNNEFVLKLKSEIPSDERDEIKLICESLGFQGLNYVFKVDSEMKTYPGVVDIKPNAKHNLQLVASSLIQKQFPRIILYKYEEDEDFWIQNRKAIFSGEEIELAGFYLPKRFSIKGTKCFFDASVFDRSNLIVYLSLYEIVIIAFHFKSSRDFYKMFKINIRELKELIFRGRLLFVAPQNLIRYPERLLLDILSVNPDAIIFSGRLVASTLQGIQKKLVLSVQHILRKNNIIF